MFITIQNSEHLDMFEQKLREMLRASRLDVSIFKSMSYVKLRQDIIKNKVDMNKTIFFANENIFIKVVEVDPVLLYCGFKELFFEGINENQELGYECFV